MSARTKPPSVSKLLETISSTSGRQPSEAFRSLTLLGACCLSAGAREPEYMAEIKRWDPACAELFSHAFGALVIEMEDHPFEDRLGPIYTIPTVDRFGCVTVTIKGRPYYLTDIAMRMLQPHELYLAQGFRKSYIIDHGAGGRLLTKTEQVRMCGNSVCPPVAEALVRANCPHLMVRELPRQKKTRRAA